MANTPALTTTFTPPASCVSNIFVERATGGNAPSGVNAYVFGNIRETARCLPDGLNPLRTSFFSPGLYCPSGYNPACSTVVSAGSARETQATCCPIGFSCKASTATFWPFDTSYGCASFWPTTEVVTVTTSSSGAYYTTQRTVRGNYDFINAYSVQLRWQSSDLTTPTATSTTSSSATSSSAAASSSAASESSGGLSTGAKVGIGLGVGIPVAAILAGLIVFLMRKKKSKAVAADGGMDSMPYSYHQQPTTEQYAHYKTAPADSAPPVEMDGRGRLPELSGTPR